MDQLFTPQKCLHVHSNMRGFFTLEENVIFSFKNPDNHRALKKLFYIIIPDRYPANFQYMAIFDPP